MKQLISPLRKILKHSGLQNINTVEILSCLILALHDRLMKVSDVDVVGHISHQLYMKTVDICYKFRWA